MTKDETLKLAQRALSNKNASTKRIYEALAAIKEALAQPAQERASPCARHCEAQAFKIEIRALKAQLAQPAPPPECKTEAEQTASQTKGEKF